MKDIIFKDIDVNKYYKSYILKKNMISFNYRDDQVFYSKSTTVMILLMILITLKILKS